MRARGHAGRDRRRRLRRADEPRHERHRARPGAGGRRTTARFFPRFQGERIVLKDAIGQALGRIATLAEDHDVCILASGDPLFFGIGALVMKKLGAEHVEVIPQPSTMQLAFARAGLKWDDAAFLSLHGRPLAGLATRLKRLSKAGIFTDRRTPRLGSPRTCSSTARAPGARGCARTSAAPTSASARSTFPSSRNSTRSRPLNVLVLVRDDPTWRPPPAIPFLHEDAFAKRMPKKGLITKREVRLLSLAALALRPDAVVWDIGAGSGSVAIEAALLAPEGRVYAIEVDPEGVEICQDNVRTHGVDNVRVVAGRAPEALADLEAPDAVFVGGSKGSMAEIIEVALERLHPGGRLVVNAITLENSAECYQAIRGRDLVPEVTLLQVSRAEPLAHYLRYEALNPIQIFAVTKPEEMR